jgi:RNA polymerase sigma factor (sigma-70 family)
MSATGPGDLVRDAAAGHERAWAELVERFGRLVWAVTRSFGLGQADAADVSQVTWLRLVENLNRLTDPDRVGAWLATTARRECLHVLRRQGRTVPTDDGAVLDATDTRPVDGPLLRAEAGALVWRALATISPRCQALLRMLATDPPPSYDEVSAALDMPIGSIGPTRGRCLERLRRAAEDFGITGDERGSVR